MCDKVCFPLGVVKNVLYTTEAKVEDDLIQVHAREA